VWKRVTGDEISNASERRSVLSSQSHWTRSTHIDTILFLIGSYFIPQFLGYDKKRQINTETVRRPTQ
jgi:hypothetical protein